MSHREDCNGCSKMVFRLPEIHDSSENTSDESQILSDRCMDIGRMGAHTYYT